MIKRGRVSAGHARKPLRGVRALSTVDEPAAWVVIVRAAGHQPEPRRLTFVTGGIEQALERAQAAAGAADVVVMGGAELGRQFLAAGLIDEIQIHLAPVLLGAGTRMFDEVELALETIEVIETPAAVRQRFRVLR